MRNKKLYIREKYGDDSSDNEDIKIPENDESLAYFKTVINQIGRTICSEFIKLLLSQNNSREISPEADEFLKEVHVLDQNDQILISSVNDEYNFTTQSQESVIWFMTNFAKFRNELFKALSQFRTQSKVCADLDNTGMAFKYAVVNEIGLRLIEWIEVFKNIDQLADEESDFDMAIEGTSDKLSLHLSAITPFKDLQKMPLSIREFMSAVTQELDSIGNILSYVIQEEMRSKIYVDSLKKQIQRYLSLLAHCKEILEIVTIKLLEAIKTKIDTLIGEAKVISGEIEEICLSYINVFQDFDNSINARVLRCSLLLESRIRFPLDSNNTSFDYDKSVLLTKCSGFRLDKASQKAKLFLIESLRSIIDTKAILINAIIHASFEKIVTEIGHFKQHPDQIESYRDLSSILNSPSTK